jgi:Zn-dependent M28 family amino/carboxypeptidase
LQTFLWKGKWGDIRGTAAKANPSAVDKNRRITVRNLIGVVPGRGSLADEAVVVSAHYDHVGVKATDDDQPDRIRNGADDNASGVAAFLMLADQLAADRRNLPKSHRTILFASFDAEERGLVGAKYYVENPIWPLEKTAIVLNFDMVGRPSFSSDRSPP